MTRFFNWKSGCAAFMATAITTGAIAPMFAPNAATAQTPDLFRRGQTNQPTNQPTSQYNSGTISIPAGVTIPVTYEKERILVTPDETTAVTLKVARNIVDSNGNLLIREGTDIKGRIEPATRNNVKGSRFVAEELILSDNNKVAIDANSPIVTRRETIKKGANTGRVLTDAAIGAGAASVIALITGNRRIETLEPVGGAAAGAVASILLRKKQVEVVSIDPENDLDVTLRSNLVLNRY